MSIVEHVDPSFQDVYNHGYGHIARIGHLTPALVDETVSRGFYRMAPPGVTLVHTSLAVTEVTVDGINDAIGRAEKAALALAKEQPQCITIGGSPTAVVGGYGSHVAMAEQIERLTGIPTLTSQAAALEAMHTLGLKRIVLVAATPYRETFTSLLTEFLEADGFEVVGIARLPEDDRGHHGYLEQMPPRQEYEFATSAFAEASQPDCIYMPAAPSPVVDIIERLERNLNTTVVTSLQAILWKGMQIADAKIKVDGFGKLLRL